MSSIFSLSHRNSSNNSYTIQKSHEMQLILEEIHNRPDTARSQSMRRISNVQRLLVRAQLHTELRLAR